MRVADLVGAQLDYWVARALGFESVRALETGSDLCIIECDGYQTKEWKPSMDWEQAGPIIARERITIVASSEEWTACYTNGSVSLDLDATATLQQEGPTPLIAAMRAYVASRCGEEVEDAPRNAG